MNAFVSFLHRYLTPFLAGICAASATVVPGIAAAVLLTAVAAALLWISLPAGGRAIQRIVRAQN